MFYADTVEIEMHSHGEILADQLTCKSRLWASSHCGRTHGVTILSKAKLVSIRIRLQHARQTSAMERTSRQTIDEICDNFLCLGD